ncbi:MAG: DUF368 domain-containing protein [Leeuwenhoekiella sp.]
MTQNRSLIAYVTVGLKGLAMGAADVVPGVSGGTIAFITGIYEELIGTLDKVDLGFFKLWKQSGFKTAFREYNLGFLLALFGGIIVSILSLAKVITYLMEFYPLMLWGFFFGLILASILLIGKQVSKWTVGVMIAAVVGTAVSYYITIAEPLGQTDSYFFLFLSGFMAIIAMILPGISGAFILLLLGSYAAVLGTIESTIDAAVSKNYAVLREGLLKMFMFVIGCVTGLKVFSKALTYLFENYKDLTLALLTGFMIGALNKVWPWKEVISYRTDSHGVEIPFLDRSILPMNFDGDPKILIVLSLAAAGFLLIFLMERYANVKPVDAD